MARQVVAEHQPGQAFALPHMELRRQPLELAMVRSIKPGRSSAVNERVVPQRPQKPRWTPWEEA
jgi:hypothetical protein